MSFKYLIEKLICLIKGHAFAKGFGATLKIPGLGPAYVRYCERCGRTIKKSLLA